jgi:hypothetical protein
MQPGVKEYFREPSGAALNVDLPAAKAAFEHLGSMYPLPIHWRDLEAAVAKRLSRALGSAEVDSLGAILLTGFTIGLVELHAGPPTFVRQPGDRPVASHLVRRQLLKGEMMVTSLRHSPIRVENPLSRQLILALDGTRDRSALLDELVAWAVANPAPNQSPATSAEFRRLLADQIEPGLQSVAAKGLLIA